MRVSNLVRLVPLLSVVLALPTNPKYLHEHKDKRDIVTKVVYVTVGEEEATSTSQAVLLNGQFGLEAGNNQRTTTTLQQEITSSTNTEIPVSITTTANSISAAAAIIDSTTTSTTPTSAVVTSTSPASSSSASSSVSDAGAKGISYSPYSNSGGCKSLSEIKSDLSILSNYDVIRIYGVDCDQVANLLQAKASSQKLFLGIYYMDQIQAGVETIQAAVSSYGSWDDIYTVSIGNELVNAGEATPSQIKQYIDTGRSALTSAGYTGPVVSVDTFVAVINNPDLCNYSDYIAVNAHAYFDYNTAAADAGTWLATQIDNVYKACGSSKNVLITESGWPSKGDTYGAAIPSKANQETAIAAIKEKCGSQTLLFTAYNDYWKSPGQYGVEQYWGIYSSE
ncbi:hypothetical protein Kpol_513p26 [Vanderwaltozyma polyspora DSM 70294]|uniref:Uncharacterized protein n=1 Tax=Vanderwaltozyma polyspora (strain ATCC 22028 / DSM 70294 / BCRC 21397 / CBS 2163 / NBRC 10782 / NRRL Y-8283 / UCD 57-17) TaxID=436907 RepID=A7TML2_VANPO|nr:uncharacterized protein Kpol_513p26 [Vanderwaltozyma polyspora DSM 70294]EDO16510.1 hypothetical protein Kpol_513p26 [Vanderwaltozyma polyspora DSM 70294]